jgi:hypothetical protein
MHGHDGKADGEEIGQVVGALHEHHRRDDGARPGQQRSAERDHRDVAALGGLGIVELAREQFQRDQQEQQSTGALQGSQADVQVVENGLTEQSKGDDHGERHGHGLPGCPSALAGTEVGRQRQEERDRAGRIHDHKERHEALDEQLPVHATPSCGTSRPAAAAAA